jgi:K+-transporting ATPase KdpF subunit
MPMVARRCEAALMTDGVWLGAVTLVVFGYLMYALLAPETF